MKRTHTLSTDSLLVKLLLFFLAFRPAFPQQEGGIFFHFNQKPLTESLDSLMEEYDLSIVYQDIYLTGKTVDALCENCTIDEALSTLLIGSGLEWTQRNNQFIIGPSGTGLKIFNIMGYITDQVSGEFIPNANIHVLHSYMGNVSSENGFFILPNIQTKICTLKFSYIGYEPETIILGNQKEKSYLLNVKLSPIILSGPGVTVTGERYDVIQQGENISQISYSPQNVATIPNLGENDVLRSLQLLPGIQGGNVGSAGLFIRGGAPDENKILLDGISLYQIDHFFGFVSSINPEAIKDIQVYKSAFPVRFGGRVNSVINLTGKNGDMNHTRFSVHTNQLSSGFSFQQPFLKRGSFLLMFRTTFADKFHSDFYNKIYQFLTEGSGLNVNGAIIQTDSTATESYTPTFDFSDMNAKLTFFLSDQNIMYFSYYSSQDKLTERSNFEFDKGFINVNTNDDTEWHNDGASIKMSHQWENYSFTNILISNSIYHSNYVSRTSWIYESTPDRISFSDTVEFVEKNELEDLSFQFDQDGMINNHKLLFGAKKSFFQTNFDIVQDQDSIFYKEVSRNTLSLFAEDQVAITDRFALNTGFRVSHFSEYSAWSVLPRLALGYKLNPFSNIKFAVGQYIQYMHRFSNDFILSGNKFVWLLSSDELKPITATHQVAGYYLTLNHYVINWEIYKNHKNNIASFSRLLFPGDVYDHGQVIQGKEYSSGMEVLAQKTEGDITGWMSFNYGVSRWTFDELNGGKTFLSSHDRNHEFKIVATTKLGPFSVTFSWVFLSGKVYTNNSDLVVFEDELGNVSLEAKPGTLNNRRLPDIHRLDMNVYKTTSLFGLNWEVGLSLFNVYNNHYISHKRYIFSASPNQSIMVNDVKVMGVIPTLFFRLSR